MLLGYARISTSDQNFDLQIDALTKHGCKRFYKDTVSGAKSKRPGLDEMLKEARPKDVIVIWKLDRLGSSYKYVSYGNGNHTGEELVTEKVVISK